MTATLNIRPLALPGALLIEPIASKDARGTFVKTFHANQLAEHGLNFALREEFYSVSHRGVLRGMHFQTPPSDNVKLVTCLRGRVLDVLVDLRVSSPAYGQCCSLELCGASPELLWIPRGVAHGFLALEDETCMAYKTDCEYAPSQDKGIRWDSFAFAWPIPAEQLAISPRDQQHPPLSDYQSPF